MNGVHNGQHLHLRSRGRRAAVKAFLMDQRVVAGVGNIYAAEALFRAGIHPARAAGRISQARYMMLAVAIRDVLDPLRNIDQPLAFSVTPKSMWVVLPPRYTSQGWPPPRSE